MRRKTKQIIFAVSFFALLGLCVQAKAEIQIGDTAPVLTVKEIDGTEFDLSKLQGKVVVIHFWASWCAPCRVEMPELAAFYRHYHGQGVEVLGFSMDGLHDLSAVKKVIAAFEMPAALARDSKDNGFGAPSILPITYVVDRTGSVKAILTPDQMPLTEKVLADIVKPLLTTH